MRFDPQALAFHAPPLLLAGLSPLIDGAVAADGAPEVGETGSGWQLRWALRDPHGGSAVLDVATGALPEGTSGVLLHFRLEGIVRDAPVASLGLRFECIEGVRSYLRSGYTSWDGSFFADPAALASPNCNPRQRVGHALTQLLPAGAEGSVVLGFVRHDRSQSRFRFAAVDHGLSVDAETLWDRVPHDGSLEAEPLILFASPHVEEALRAWARLVADPAPSTARPPAKRIAGWCSWYNLYGAITEENLREHLAAAKAAKDSGLPLEIFQIDDGFTPEMGDWLDVKPQFPSGMASLLAEIAASSFTPGLWIAPFLVGNRSRLLGEHPDWVVRERDTGAPLAHMKFYGEFRWHKRSEEYYVLDVTHPQAEAYIRGVFRTWRRDWGCRYFKTDFMNAGSDYGPERAVWHRKGLSRIEIWMIMARLIREEIGDALWLGCGCPLFPAVGLIDAMRIGRDVGVKWSGEQSAESLLRDQATRNFANGIFWQADPDCVLLRDRFHHLTDAEVESLALFAGLSGGVLMTSDHLGELSGERGALFAFLLGDGEVRPCDFPLLGAPASSQEGPLVVQRVRRPGPEGATAIVYAFNTGDAPFECLLSWSRLGVAAPASMQTWNGEPTPVDPAGLRLSLPPHHSACFVLRWQPW